MSAPAPRKHDDKDARHSAAAAGLVFGLALAVGAALAPSPSPGHPSHQEDGRKATHRPIPSPRHTTGDAPACEQPVKVSGPTSIVVPESDRYTLCLNGRTSEPCVSSACR
ncbi:hypothetical protein ACH4UM_41215 [Streptomyces sp. NPDC020801]|uniref:hypothetical protein n=1 Tax=unclassified Streptomyces TaxID=2593676 RepID=UPI0037A9B631